MDENGCEGVIVWVWVCWGNPGWLPWVPISRNARFCQPADSSVGGYYTASTLGFIHGESRLTKLFLYILCPCEIFPYVQPDKPNNNLELLH